MSTEDFSIEVVAFKQHDDATYIGRGSPLGNPFRMETEDQRHQVCDDYEDYFSAKVETDDPDIMGELHYLVEVAFEQGYLKLECFCAPRRCHGDTIKRFLDTVLNP